MLDQIIQRFGNDFGYISDIDIVIDTLKKEQTLTDEEIMQLIIKINNNNIYVYQKLKEENDKVLKAEHLKMNVARKPKTTIEKKDVSPIQTIQEKIPDIGYYLLQIDQLLKENNITFKTIKEVLPSKNDDNWKLITDLIYLNYQKKKVKLIKDKREEEELDVQELYQQDINIYQEIIEHILKYKEDILENNIKEEKTINIIFDPDTIEKDLSNIPTEKYGLILYVIEELKRNVLKNPKTFRNDILKKLISELRANDIRLFFERLDSNTYIIYYIFVKNSQNSTIYRTQFINRASLYFSKRDNMLNDFYNNETKEEFMTKSSELSSKIEILLNNKIMKQNEEIISDDNLDNDDDLGISLGGN